MIDPPLRSEDNQSEPLTPMQLQRLEEQILSNFSLSIAISCSPLSLTLSPLVSLP